MIAAIPKLNETIYDWNSSSDNLSNWFREPKSFTLLNRLTLDTVIYKSILCSINACPDTILIDLFTNECVFFSTSCRYKLRLQKLTYKFKKRRENKNFGISRWNHCSCYGEFVWIKLWGCVVYSSLSSIGITGPAFAPADDDERIGPDSFNTDEMIFPEPAEAIGTVSSFKSDEWSSDESSSGCGTGTAPPPLKPPLNPPNPPAELPLNAPNFCVIAAIFGEITACNNCWSETIGAGGSMPAALFLAMFVWSNWLRSCVLASRIPSIFYVFHVLNEHQ